MRSRAAASLASSLAITTSAGIQSPAWMDRAMAARPRRTKSLWTLRWVRSFAGGVAWVITGMVLLSWCSGISALQRPPWLSTMRSCHATHHDPWHSDLPLCLDRPPASDGTTARRRSRFPTNSGFQHP